MKLQIVTDDSFMQDHSSSEIAFPRSSFRRSSVPPTVLSPAVYNQPVISHQPLVLPCRIRLPSQGIHLFGVLVESAVTYCRVSRPTCRNILCSCTNHNITRRLQTTLHQARVRLLLVEFRVSRIRRQMVASPCQIDCVLLRQVHCHVRQIVQDVQVTQDRYCQSQVRFQHIQGMIIHSSCRSLHAEHLHQLQRSCCVQICQQLENTNLILDRVSQLLLTILRRLDLQHPNVVAAVPPPPPPPIIRNPRQPSTQPTLLIGPENVQPFQVQVEEKSKDLVSET